MVRTTYRPLIDRRQLIVAGALLASQVRAQNRDSRPVLLYVGYPPGGGIDFVARLINVKMSLALDQQLIVVNLPGATGSIALDRVAKSAPDGHSLVIISAADTILPSVRSNLPFDLLRDLVPVAAAVTGALALVVNSRTPVRSVKELVEFAKSRPDTLNFSSPGVGNSQHLAGESFNRLAGTRIVHIPFKGGAEATNAVVSGEVQVAFPTLSTAMPLVKDGRLRLLAVTSKSRSAVVPDVPTISESGIAGYDVSTWFGIAAPAGLRLDEMARLNAAVAKAIETDEVRQSLLKQGLEPMKKSQEQFAAYVREEVSRNAALATLIGLKAE